MRHDFIAIICIEKCSQNTDIHINTNSQVKVKHFIYIDTYVGTHFSNSSSANIACLSLAIVCRMYSGFCPSADNGE